MLTAHLEDGHVVDATIYLKHAGLSWFSLGGSAVPVVSLFGMRVWFGGWGGDGFRCCLLYSTEIADVEQALKIQKILTLLVDSVMDQRVRQRGMGEKNMVDRATAYPTTNQYRTTRK